MKIHGPRVNDSYFLEDYPKDQRHSVQDLLKNRTSTASTAAANNCPPLLLQSKRVSAPENSSGKQFFQARHKVAKRIIAHTTSDLPTSSPEPKFFVRKHQRRKKDYVISGSRGKSGRLTRGRRRGNVKHPNGHIPTNNLVRTSSVPRRVPDNKQPNKCQHEG